MLHLLALMVQFLQQQESSCAPCLVGLVVGMSLTRLIALITVFEPTEKCALSKLPCTPRGTLCCVSWG